MSKPPVVTMCRGCLNIMPALSITSIEVSHKRLDNMKVGYSGEKAEISFFKQQEKNNCVSFTWRMNLIVVTTLLRMSTRGTSPPPQILGLRFSSMAAGQPLSLSCLVSISLSLFVFLSFSLSFFLSLSSLHFVGLADMREQPLLGENTFTKDLRSLCHEKEKNLSP